jgi:hypothetical protein
MYNFNYDHIKKKYGDKAILIYTDTDAFIYLIETEDIYKDMKEDEHLYDFSDYLKDYFCYSIKNKVLGIMKDEMAEGYKLKIISEAIFIRSKHEVFTIE